MKEPGPEKVSSGTMNVSDGLGYIEYKHFYQLKYQSLADLATSIH